MQIQLHAVLQMDASEEAASFEPNSESHLANRVKKNIAIYRSSYQLKKKSMKNQTESSESIIKDRTKLARPGI